jgi:sugar phosphate permease
MSWILGDAVAWFSHGALINLGIPWRINFLGASLIALLCTVTIFFLSRRVQRRVGFVDDFNQRNEPQLGISPWKQRAFFGALGLSIALSLSREALLEWMPTYLVNTHLVNAGGASIVSAIIPLGAAVGTLYLGKVYFRIPGAVRPKAFRIFLTIAAIALMSVPLASQSLTLMFV